MLDASFHGLVINASGHIHSLLGKIAVDSNALGLVVLNRVMDVISNESLKIFLLDIVWELTLVEIYLTAVAFPDHLMLQCVLAKEAVDSYIIAMNLEGRMDGAFTIFSLVVVWELHVIRFLARTKPHMIGSP
jgi:hypothetical protein